VPTSLQQQRIRGPAPATGGAANIRVTVPRGLKPFLNYLPDPNLQQLVLNDQVFVDVGSLTANSVVEIVGPTTGVRVVTAGLVWIFTDIRFYALAPSRGLSSPSRKLDEHALHGLCRFEFLVDGRSATRLEAEVVSPYGNPNTTAGATNGILGLRAGWPQLNSVYGTQRESAWAVYARENQEVQGRVTFDVAPRTFFFALGLECHGFSMTTNEFDQIWSSAGAGQF
jgi:hypothetical protein